MPEPQHERTVHERCVKDNCNICDGGLFVCKWCGKAEIELDGPCVERYDFTQKPATKSSTSVLKASVCQKCGCKLDGQPLQKPCDCQCHKEGSR